MYMTYSIVGVYGNIPSIDCYAHAFNAVRKISESH